MTTPKVGTTWFVSRRIHPALLAGTYPKLWQPRILSAPKGDALSTSLMSVTHKLNRNGAGCCIPARCSALGVVQQGMPKVCQLTLIAHDSSMRISYIECHQSSYDPALACSNDQPSFQPGICIGTQQWSANQRLMQEQRDPYLGHMRLLTHRMNRSCLACD